jgi:tripartite-type tricarboxylate transporter receptor subunit TctC
MVAIAARLPWKSMRDLISAAQAKKGAVTYGSWGVGSPAQLGGAMLAGLTDSQMELIAFRDVGQLFISVSAGDVNWSLGTLPSSRPAFQAGKLRYLAVASPHRVAQMPDAPTMAESGGPAEMDLSSFAVLVALKGTPDALISKLHLDIDKATGAPRCAPGWTALPSSRSHGRAPRYWPTREARLCSTSV